jgi:hypothetical protein
MCYSKTVLTLNYTYRIYPDAVQESFIQEWLETSAARRLAQSKEEFPKACASTFPGIANYCSETA